MKGGSFPRSIIKVGPASVAWLESEIDEWINLKLANAEVFKEVEIMIPSLNYAVLTDALRALKEDNIHHRESQDSPSTEMNTLRTTSVL